jgi:predicted nucleic acid-binding protein
MTTYLLDTSVIIDVLNNKRGWNVVLKRLLDEGNLLACCAVNLIEVYAGMRPHEERATEQLLSSLEYYEVTKDIAKHAGIVKRDWAKKGVTLSVSDATIAAVTFANNLTLITDNLKHYPMPEIKIYLLPRQRS